MSALGWEKWVLRKSRGWWVVASWLQKTIILSKIQFFWGHEDDKTDRNVSINPTMIGREYDHMDEMYSFVDQGREIQ